MKTTYERALAFVLTAEGGYSDDAGDSGGPTMRGLTWRDIAAHRKIAVSTITTHAQEAALAKSLTHAELEAIYKANYWDAVDGDELPYPLDLITFDAGVNMGIGTAVWLLNEAAGLPERLRPDAALLDRLNAKVAVNKLSGVEAALFTERIARYHAIVAAHPVDARFLTGWLNRVTALRAEAAKPG